MKLLLLPNTEKPNIYACVRKLLSLHFEQPVEFWMDERFVPFFPDVQFGKFPQNDRISLR